MAPFKASDIDSIPGGDRETAKRILSNLSTRNKWRSARQLRELMYPDEYDGNVRKVLEDRIERVIARYLIENGTVEFILVPKYDGNTFKAYRKAKERTTI